MGIVDFLKKIFTTPEGRNPLLAMEPQCVRYEWLTLRLPAGWQFTEADFHKCKASGPGGCSMDLCCVMISGEDDDDGRLKVSDFEKHRKYLIQLQGKHFLAEKSVQEIVLPTGVVWLEAVDTQGKDERLRIALLNPKPRNSERMPPILQITCVMPAASAGAEQFERLREALRNIEW